MKKAPKISIAIPTYEMKGEGHNIIQYALKSIQSQRFRDFEVVVSDQSPDDLTKEVCRKWLNEMDVVYVKNTNPKDKGCYTANTNNAVRHCSGEIVKYLDADDYLYDEDSLGYIYDSFEEGTIWIATDYVHTYDRVNLFKRHSPIWNPKIYLYNTIGSPIGESVRRENVIEMDEHYRWMGDADLYKMMYDKWGTPKIVRYITAVHLLWEGQNSNVLGALEREEVEYSIRKYKEVE